MAGADELSIVTVFHNHEGFVDSYFQSFEKVYGAPPCSLLLADNGSTDKSFSLLRSYAEKYPDQIRLFSNANLGFAKANNQLVRHAKTDYLCFLNPDICFEREFISPCLSVLKKHGGLVSPELRDPGGCLLPNFSPFYERSNFFLRKIAYRLLPWNKVQPVDWIMGASLFCRRDEFQALGGFDEHYFLFTEDMDLCRRYADMNLSRFILKNVILNHPRRIIDREKFLRMARNLKRYFLGRSYQPYLTHLHIQAFLGRIPGDYPGLFLKIMEEKNGKKEEI